MHLKPKDGYIFKTIIKFYILELFLALYIKTSFAKEYLICIAHCTKNFDEF